MAGNSPLSSPEAREHHGCAPAVGAPDRRGFLRLFGAGLVGAAAVALAPALPDPEKLNWVPGAKAYFDIQKRKALVFKDLELLPPGNTFVTMDMITKEALAVLEKNLIFTKNIHRDYDEVFQTQGARIGDTISVRKPARFGRTPESKMVTLDHQFGVEMEFSSSDIQLSMDDFADRFIRPAARQLAERMDQSLAEMNDQAISLRITRSYNIQRDSFPTRMDVLYGFSAMRPEFIGKVKA